MRASAAVGQQITGSFQISGNCRSDRHEGARRSLSGNPQESPAARMPMKDGYAPIIVIVSTSRFLENESDPCARGPGIATYGYASTEIPECKGPAIAIGCLFILRR
jgi:hypothetical protein